MRLRYLIVASFVAAALLSLRWEWSRPVSFEDAVTNAMLVEQIRRDGSRCPLSQDAIDSAKAWALAACAQGGLGWYEAAERYGDDAEKVYLTYGWDPGFVEVFERLGPPVVPVIAYFVRNGSTQYYVQDAVGQGLARLWGGAEDRRGELTPEQYGLVAIGELRHRGHEMLSEFEIVDGVAVRKPFTRTVLAAKNLAFGGVTDLEQVLARGERLPSWSEVGWASFDAAVLVGGAGLVVKILRTAKAPVALGAKAATGAARLRPLASAGRGAFQSLAAVGKVAGVAAVVAIPYIAVTRPYLLAGAGAWIAEQAGLPGWLGAFLVYLAFCIAIALALRLLLGPFAWILRLLGRFGSWIARDGPAAHVVAAAGTM
jgi:hypothetical protein